MAGGLEAGLGIGFLDGMPGSWHLLYCRSLADSAAVVLIPGTFYLGKVEFEVAPWDQNSGRCWTTSAVRRYIGLNRSVQGTSGSEMGDRKIVGRVVDCSVVLGGNDGDALAVLGSKADGSKQMLPTKETADKKGAADSTLAETGIAVVLTIGESPTLSMLRIPAFRTVGDYWRLPQHFGPKIFGRRLL